MATYTFETITAAQALLLAPKDTLAFAGGSANRASVAFASGGLVLADTITITSGGRSATFTSVVSAVSQLSGLTFPDGSRLFIGDPLPNVANGTGRNDGFFGGDGADVLRATAGNVVMQGNQGDDQLVGGSGNDTLYGGQDNDTIMTGGGSNVAQGNVGLDTLLGGPGNDTLLGGKDSDTVSGGGGADLLDGNLGDDSVLGGAQAETVLGEDGNDTLSGGSGGTDTVDGGAGNDLISVGAGVARGGDGNDTISTLPNSAASSLDGGTGNDLIAGSAPVINGGAGADTLSPGSGRNLLVGGDGADVFSFTSGASGADLAQGDVISDWLAGDTIRFVGMPVTAATYVEQTATSAALAQSAANALIAAGTRDVVAVQVGSDVLIFADTARNNGQADDVVTLMGRTLADIAAANFTS